MRTESRKVANQSSYQFTLALPKTRQQLSFFLRREQIRRKDGGCCDGNSRIPRRHSALPALSLHSRPSQRRQRKMVSLDPRCMASHGSRSVPQSRHFEPGASSKARLGRLRCPFSRTPYAQERFSRSPESVLATSLWRQKNEEPTHAQLLRG